MDVKIDVGVVLFQAFFQLRFGIVFGSFFGRPIFKKSIKTIGFSMVLANFHEIGVYKTSTPKVQFCFHFGMPKPLKIDQK